MTLVPGDHGINNCVILGRCCRGSAEGPQRLQGLLGSSAADHGQGLELRAVVTRASSLHSDMGVSCRCLCSGCNPTCSDGTQSRQQGLGFTTGAWLLASTAIAVGSCCGYMAADAIDGGQGGCVQVYS